MIARQIVVLGRVQGVGFRWSTAAAARRAGCQGWARNLPDGTVEIHLQGDHHAVAEMEEWLAHGPAGARVDEIRSRGATVDPSLSGFAIR